MNYPLVVLVGPTATGKSDLALAIAKKFKAEIVSADSWLVRKELNIGAAKPTAEEMSAVPHHMIDLITPCEDYSAARYKQEATEALAQIQANGKLAILVGGTGLYVDSILYDYSFMPAARPKLHSRLNDMPLEELHRLALGKGLDLAAIDKRNKRRVVRLIETNGMVASKGEIRRSTLVIGLRADREQLRRSIAERVDRMITKGLEQEVAGLAKRYGWDCEALKGIGYSEWRLYFDRVQPIELVRDRIIKDTFELAKRQQTWFKRNKSIQWFDTPVKLADVDALITTYLSKLNFI